MSPYCIDDEQCLFIFNDCDLRALKYGTNSTVLLAKRKSNNTNAVTNSKRYILRIPKVVYKQDLSNGQIRRLDSLMQLAKEDEESQKIKIEIFGIEPLQEISVFDKIFEKINTLLLNQTIDKFSEKFLKPVEV